MKNLTKSDLTNIEALKAVLIMLSNDIKDVKAKVDIPANKAEKIFALYRHKAQLINSAADKYPHINWLNVALGEETNSERSLKDTVRIKIETRLNLN
jgi:hypothetical protein